MLTGTVGTRSAQALAEYSSLVKAAARAPRQATSVLLAIARGYWYRATCRLRGIRFEAGRNLRVFGRLSFRGPGRVRFGDDVVVDMTVTPWTYDADASIEIGDGTILNGTHFGCIRKIIIGAQSLVGSAAIMDTNFHSTSINRRDPSAPIKSAPVHIGSNVWIGAHAGILPGTRIGDNSVVGFGAVCVGKYPANMLIGPPRATVLRPLL